MNMTSMKNCTECQAGDHENYDDNVQTFIVRDPDTRTIRKMCLCGEHQSAMDSDGYELKAVA